MSNYDVIVIGAGHNGLTAANYFTKSGKKVLVVEANETVGGLAQKEEFHPGFTSAGLMIDSSGYRQWIAKDLELEKHGLRRHTDEVPVFCPTAEGKGYMLWRDISRAADEMSQSKEFEAYKSYLAFFDRTRPFLKQVFNGAPPDIAMASMSGLWDMAKKAVALRRLGKADMMELLRVSPMCIADYMREFFTDEHLSASLAQPAIQHTFTGPWSAGGVANLLLAEASREKPVLGGPAALVAALEKALLARGGEIKVSTRVNQLLFDGKRVIGVKTAGGDEYRAGRILATTDVRELLFEMTPPEFINRSLEHSLGAIRSRGTTAVIHFALSGLPEFRSRPGVKAEFVRVCQGLNEQEKAYDPTKYGKSSEHPALDLYFPSLEDSSLAPEGKHVATAHVHFATWQDGSEEHRQQVYNAAIKQLQMVSDNFAGLVEGSKTYLPTDIGVKFRIPNGHLHHIEHSLDQLVVRPILECLDYQTPFEGLYVGGSGCFPSGGVTGAPGAMAAKTMMM